MVTVEEQRLSPDAKAPPFHYNPSSIVQRARIAMLAFVAAAISFYLAAYQWGWIEGVWDPFFGAGSETVLTSEESEAMHRIIGLPDAALGSWAYLTEVVLAMAGSTRRWQFRPWLVMLFGLDVIPLGIVSVVLVVLQGIAVGAWCTPCLVTAAISLVLVFLAYDEIWSCAKYLRHVWKRQPELGPFWRTFWGNPSPRAIDVAYEMRS